LPHTRRNMLTGSLAPNIWPLTKSDGNRDMILHVPDNVAF